MDKQLIEEEYSQWFSTYGVITSQRILSRYQINLPSIQLLEAIKSPVSFYHKLVQVPLKNVLNGIIIQQASDFHVYAQKLFIDYLLSGESGKSPESQGAATREALEDERKQLITLGEEFQKKQLEHDSLIASSQSSIMKLSREYRDVFEKAINLIHSALSHSGIDVEKSLIRQGLTHALIYCHITNAANTDSKYLFIEKINEILKSTLTNELKEKLAAHLEDLFKIMGNFDETIQQFLTKVIDLGIQARSFRTRFYDSVLRVIELLNMLSEYKINAEQDAINREPLYFDKTLGGS